MTNKLSYKFLCSKQSFSNRVKLPQYCMRYFYSMPPPGCRYQGGINKLQTRLFIGEAWYYLCSPFTFSKHPLKEIRGTDTPVMVLWKFQIGKALLEVFLKAFHGSCVSVFKALYKGIATFKTSLVTRSIPVPAKAGKRPLV